MIPRALAGWRRTLWALAGQLLLSFPAGALPTAGEKAAAEALFREGTQLMNEKNFAQACAKFEASNAIEPGLGTKLWLADCYDRAGRTASAWALFSEAAALAQRASQSERETAARQRAADLEQRLSKLELKLPADGLPPDVTVTLNGVAIPLASLGSALPVDPGPQKIVLRAPGYHARALESDVGVGPVTLGLDVPPLEPKPEPAPVKAASEPTGDRALAERRPANTRRVLGFAIGGLGLLGLGGGGVLAYRAYSLDSQSRDHCLADDPNACAPEGTSLRDQARTFGNVATAVTIAGAALTATGVVLLLTAPSRSSETPARVGVGTRLGPAGGELILTGTL